MHIYEFSTKFIYATSYNMEEVKVMEAMVRVCTNNKHWLGLLEVEFIVVVQTKHNISVNHVLKIKINCLV